MPETDSSSSELVSNNQGSALGMAGLAPTISSDPGTMDYYKGWADWLHIALPQLDYSDPKNVEFFEDLKQRVIDYRKSIGLQSPDPSGPVPSAQVGAGGETWVPMAQASPRTPSQVEPHSEIGGNPSVPSPWSTHALGNQQGFMADPGMIALPTQRPLMHPQQDESVIDPRSELRGGLVPGAIKPRPEAIKEISDEELDSIHQWLHSQQDSQIENL